MTDFSPFIEAYGEPVDHELADESTVDSYRGAVPDQLLEFWERYGFGGFGKGLVWVVNPSQLKTVFSEWESSRSARAVPVVRTAFGNILYWENPSFTLLDVHYNRRVPAGTSTEVLFG